MSLLSLFLILPIFSQLWVDFEFSGDPSCIGSGVLSFQMFECLEVGNAFLLPNVFPEEALHAPMEIEFGSVAVRCAEAFVYVTEFENRTDCLNSESLANRTEYGTGGWVESWGPYFDGFCEEKLNSFGTFFQKFRLNGSCPYISCQGYPAWHPMACSGHGRCNSLSGECTCSAGYNGTACELFWGNCWGTFAQDPTVCSSNGTCVAQDLCWCVNGYEPPDCSQFSCFGDLSGDAAACGNGSGTCVGPNECECEMGFSEPTCSTIACESTCVFGMCFGDECRCHPGSGYSGQNCDEWSCGGFPRMDGMACSGNGFCEWPEICTCFGGWSGPECSVSSCNCSGHGTCVGVTPVECECETDWRGDPMCSSCSPNREGEQCDVALPCTEEMCNFRGSCVQESQSCQCSPPFAGDFCEGCLMGFYGDVCEFFCDGETTCSGHGTCDSGGDCTCEPMWDLPDCSVCVEGWFGPSCNMAVPPSQWEFPCVFVSLPEMEKRERHALDCPLFLPFEQIQVTESPNIFPRNASVLQGVGAKFLPSEITIRLLRSAAWQVFPGDFLEISIGRLIQWAESAPFQGGDDGSEAHVYRIADMQDPPELEIPSSAVEPLTVGSCDDAIFEWFGVSSDIEFHYNLTSWPAGVQPEPIVSVLQSFTNKAPPHMLSRETLNETASGDYVFEVYITNSFGDVSSKKSIVLTKESVVVPHLLVQPWNAVSYVSGETVLFSLDAGFCDSTVVLEGLLSEYTFSWSLLESPASLLFDTNTYTLAQQDRRLEMETGNLTVVPDGVYVWSACVETNADPAIFDCVNVTATITKPPLSLWFDLGNHYADSSSRHTVNVTFVDPAEATTTEIESFLWTCLDDLTQSDCSHLISEPTLSWLVLEPNVYGLGSFTFNFVWTKGDRSVSGKSTITLVNYSPPAVAILYVSEPRDGVVLFEGNVEHEEQRYFADSDEGGVAVRMRWKLLRGDVELDLGTYSPSYAYNTFMFSLRANLFAIGEEVTVVLSAHVNGLSAVATYVYGKVNPAPFLGSCTVNPSSGVMYSTPFRISCSGFSDPEGESLSYEFRLLQLDSPNYVILSDGPSPTLTTVIGNPGQSVGSAANYTIPILVRDPSGGQVESSVRVEVVQPGMGSEETFAFVADQIRKSELSFDLSGCLAEIVVARQAFQDAVLLSAANRSAIDLRLQNASGLCFARFQGAKLSNSVVSKALNLKTAELDEVRKNVTTERVGKALDDLIAFAGSLDATQVKGAMQILDAAADMLSGLALAQQGESTNGFSALDDMIGAANHFRESASSLISNLAAGAIVGAEEIRIPMESIEILVFACVGDAADDFPDVFIGSFSPSVRRNVGTGFSAAVRVKRGISNGVLALESSLLSKQLPPTPLNLVSPVFFYRLTSNGNSLGVLPVNISLVWRGSFPLVEGKEYACATIEIPTNIWIEVGWAIRPADRVDEIECIQSIGTGHFGILLVDVPPAPAPPPIIPVVPPSKFPWWSLGVIIPVPLILIFLVVALTLIVFVVLLFLRRRRPKKPHLSREEDQPVKKEKPLSDDDDEGKRWNYSSSGRSSSSSSDSGSEKAGEVEVVEIVIVTEVEGEEEEIELPEMKHISDDSSSSAEEVALPPLPVEENKRIRRIPLRPSSSKPRSGILDEFPDFEAAEDWDDYVFQHVTKDASDEDVEYLEDSAEEVYDEIMLIEYCVVDENGEPIEIGGREGEGDIIGTEDESDGEFEIVYVDISDEEEGEGEGE